MKSREKSRKRSCNPADNVVCYGTVKLFAFAINYSLLQKQKRQKKAVKYTISRRKLIKTSYATNYTYFQAKFFYTYGF